MVDGGRCKFFLVQTLDSHTMTTFVLILLAVVTILVVYFIQRRKANKLPPGPWLSVPILGHLPLLGQDPHKKLLEWKRLYGPIISCKMGGFPAVVLVDGKIIREAFTTPAFSGRCAIKPFVDASCNKGIIFGDSPFHLEHRDFFVKNMKKQFSSSKIQSKIQEEMLIFLDFVRQKSCENEENLMTVNGMFQCPVINSSWSLIMGERFDNGDTKLDYLADLITSGFLRVDTFSKKVGLYLPWAGKYLPELSGYSDICGSLREIYDYIQQRIDQRKLTWVKDQPRDITDVYFDMMANTTDISSVFHKKNDGQRFATGEIFFAALDPTGKTLEWLMYYLARYPATQKKFQEEIDREIGHQRLPSLNDRPRMSYTTALINELLRITTTGAMAMFHRAVVDIPDFHGYHIPKDTMVISNLWGCCNDPDVWEEPEIFRPDRFLKKETDKKMDNFLTFGVGKRMCIGDGVARDQIFLVATTLFQKFCVALSNPDAPPVKTVYGLNLTADIFQVKVTERVITH